MKALDNVILIETKWNLNSFVRSLQSYGQYHINRNKVEFKFLIFHLVPNSSPDINRNKVEFKCHQVIKIYVCYLRILIETKWNLNEDSWRYGRSSRPY